MAVITMSVKVLCDYLDKEVGLLRSSKTGGATVILVGVIIHVRCSPAYTIGCDLIEMCSVDGTLFLPFKPHENDFVIHPIRNTFQWLFVVNLEFKGKRMDYKLCWGLII